MNCSGFENELTALVGGELAEDLRGPCLDRLRRHAANCEQCAGTQALLDLQGLPPAERDLVDDPPAAYWETFDERLAVRIAEAEATPAEPPARRRWPAAVAATVGLLGLLGGSLWLRTGGEPDEQLGLTWLMAENMAQESSAYRVELPDELAVMLESLSADQAADALDGLGGLEVTPWDLESWADPADSGDEYEVLLGDVEDLEQLALLGDGLPGDSLAAEAGLAGAATGPWPLFPDPNALDGTARKEFLLWLYEQVSSAAGVS